MTPAEKKSVAWGHRHPSVLHFELLFEYDHLPGALREVSKVFHDAAVEFLLVVKDDNPEVSAGLRKLREAKDCAVTALMIALKA
jgi:uncharacterized protein YcaQ